MVFSTLKAVIYCVMQFFLIPITIEGYTFNMWQILLFSVISGALGVIVVGVLRGD